MISDSVLPICQTLAELQTPELALTEKLMVAVFVIGVLAWGFRMRKSAGTLEGSFLAGRKVPGVIASLSTVATNLNANDFIGHAGAVYMIGVVMCHGKWINGLALVFAALLIMPKLRRLNVFTLGGWLEKRYSPAVGISYSAVWSLIWMLFNLGLYLYAGALVLHSLVGWDLIYSIVLLSIIAAVYTLIGGFGAVVATDVLQVALMFFPFIFVAGAVYVDVGSISALAASLPAEKAVYWPAQTKFGPISVTLFGMFFMGLSYWSSEAQVVQRPLSARSEEDATISFLGATFWLSILMPLLVSLPALAAIAYFPNLENPDLAMPSLIVKFLPPGLYGVAIVGLMAGVFSSADSQINAFCTMFTTDVYKRVLRPNKTESHYLAASKVSGVIFTLAAIDTALLFTTRQEGMMLFAISVLAVIMPPFAAVTIVGVLYPKASARGALAGLIIGGATAIALVFLAYYGRLENIASDTLFLRALITFVTTASATVIASLIFKTPAARADQPAIDLSLRLSPRVLRLALILVLAMIGFVIFWSVHFHQGVGVAS